MVACNIKKCQTDPCGHPASNGIIDEAVSTTLLVSARAKGLDLVGLNEPEDEILEEPEEHLAMDMRQRATRD